MNFISSLIFVIAIFRAYAAKFFAGISFIFCSIDPRSCSLTGARRRAIYGRLHHLVLTVIEHTVCSLSVAIIRKSVYNVI